MTSKWCPSCGDEYETRIEQCLDCLVPLVDDAPKALEPVGEGFDDNVASPHPVYRFDISGMISERRSALFEHLETVPIPFLVVDEDTLEALPGYEVELTEAVAGVMKSERLRKLRSAVPLDGEPLGLVRRTGSVLIDAIVAGVITSLAVRSGDGGVTALIVLTLLFMNQAVGIGERGLSIGKLVAGGRVRSTRGGSISLGEATVRWMIKDAFTIAALAIAGSIDDPSGIWLLLQLLAFCYFGSLVASVAIDQQRRGLHDQLVGSAVVSSRSLTH